MTKSKMNLETWYGRSLRIPSYTDGFFISFVSSSIGLVNSILQSDLGRRIRVRFTTVGTACADQENKIIYINQNILKGILPERNVRVGSVDAITFILGLIVHETGHFAYSPPTTTVFSDYIKNGTTNNFLEALAGGLSNVLEDIYIEAELDRCFPSISWMLNLTNELFFDKFEISKRIVAVEKVDVAPKYGRTAAEILNALVISRIDPDQNLTPYMQNLFDLALSVQEMPNLADRQALSLKMYDLIAENLEVKPEDVPQINKIIISICKEAESREKKHNDAIQNADISPQAKKMEERLRHDENKIVVFIKPENSTGFIPPNILTEIALQVLPNRPQIEMDKRFSVLAQVGRQKATVNRAYGLDKKRGNSIRKLYRISTDQKIFAEPVDRQGLKPMQVMLVLDCSGSMRMHPVNRMNPSLGVRLTAGQEAMLGAAVALAEAHCDVAVYGHLADSGDDNSVTILRAKGFNEPIAGLASRLADIGRQDSGGNRDGHALEYLAKKIKNKRKRRILIIVSDGLPMGNDGYQGDVAIRHCKGVVDRIRREGIEVYSISIAQDAVEANNEIYGEKNNIANNDPRCIEHIVSKLIGAS